MVIVGDFKVELVDAQTKEPFPEHYSKDDGQIYVEVEADREYYVSYQRMTSHHHNNTSSSSSANHHHHHHHDDDDHQEEEEEDIIVTCSVDGKDLGWAADYFHNETDYQPNYGGSWDCIYNDKSCHEIRKKNALHIINNIMQTTTTSPHNIRTTTTMMIGGEIEFYIWKMGNEIIEPSHSYQSDFGATTFDDDDDDDGDDYFLSSSSNSTLGSTFEIENVQVEENCLYEEGRLLQTITLNYRNKDALIYDGVILAKPPPPPDNDLQVTMKPELIQLQQQQQQQHNRGETPNVFDMIGYELFDLTSSNDMSPSTEITRKKGNDHSRRAKLRKNSSSGTRKNLLLSSFVSHE